MASLYATNFNVTVMMDRYDWYFLPVANPDGYEYTHTAVSMMYMSDRAR